MEALARTRSPHLEKAFGPIRPKLKLVEDALAAHLESPIRSIREVGEYLLEGGGKRIRPALLLMVSNLLTYDGDLDVLYATVIEYIHTATLIHDDVIDEAGTRRGRVSANVRWGNSKTVLFGDYLYTRAIRLALSAGDLRILRLLNESILRMIEGEILAAQAQGSMNVTSEEYLEILRRKTAVLFAATCEIPALLAPEGEKFAERLKAFGFHLGTAFQLVDDLLDFTASEEVLGKPVLSDLREGRMTLPLILALPEATPAEGRAIETVLRERAFESVSAETIRALVDRHGTVAKTRSLALENIERARDALAGFGKSEARDALFHATEFILCRDH